MRDHVAVEETLVARIARFAHLGTFSRTPDGPYVKVALAFTDSPLTLGHRARTIDECVAVIEGQIAALRGVLPADAMAAYEAAALPAEGAPLPDAEVTS